MRSKIIDQFKYQKAAGTAFDRTGYNTGIFVCVGGTASTAIKVQTCSTSGGTFTDLATLVAAADAATTTDVGIAVDLSGAEKYVKVTGATTASCILGDGIVDPAS